MGRLDRAAALLALGTGTAAIIAVAAPAATAATAAAATFVTVFALLFAAGLAALGRRFIPGITRLFARATVVSVVTTPAASATVAAAVVPGLAVAAKFVALTASVGPGLGRGGFLGEEALEPAEEAAGLFRGGGGGALGAREIALTVTLTVAGEGAALGAFATGGGFAARFTRLERPRLAAIAAAGAERRPLVTAVAVVAGGAFTPADGRTLHFLGGEDVELDLRGGCGGFPLGRRSRREREQLGLGGRSRRGSRSGHRGRGHDRLSHGGRGGDGHALDHEDRGRSILLR